MTTDESTVIPVRERLFNPEYGELNDFKVFLFLVWAHLKLPKPTPVQLDIADYLQHGPERLIIMAFRGVGKSWITAAYVCWCLMLDPQLKILIVSKSSEKALEISQFIRRLLAEMVILKHLSPEESERNTVKAFDVFGADGSIAPSVKALGIDGQLAGSRADIIIPDDVETLQNSMTQLQRERLNKAVKEFDAILKPGGVVAYLGTPQVEDSLYTELENRGYQSRIWPARFPTEKQLQNGDYYRRLAPWIHKRWSKDKIWKNVDTARFSEDDLAARELSYGPSGFLLQYMLDTTLSDQDRYPIKLKDLMVMAFSGEMAPVALSWGNTKDLMLESLPSVGFNGDRFYRPFFVSEHWEPFDRIVMAIDPSGRGGDETGYAVVGLLKGLLFLLESGGLVGGYEEATLLRLAQVAQKWKVHRIVVEGNFGDGMYLKLFKPVLNRVHSCTLEEVNSSLQKERRMADTLEPIIAGHRLVVIEDVIRKDYNPNNRDNQLFYQMSRLTRDRGSLKHDDRLDALAMAVADHVEYLALDTATNEQDYQSKLRLEALEDFLRAADGLTRGVKKLDKGSLRLLH